MGQKFELDGKEYDVENLSDTSKKMLAHMDFTNKKKKSPYSMDANLLHISYEGGNLEDPWWEAEEDMWRWSVSPEAAPDQATYVTLTYEKGDIVAIDGERLSGAAILSKLNKLGGDNGIGRLDIVENRYVGMKSRGCYETPGGTIMLPAHRAIESLTLDRESAHLKDSVMPKYAELLYNGYWWSPERLALQKLIDGDTGPPMIGVSTYPYSVAQKLYKDDFEQMVASTITSRANPSPRRTPRRTRPQGPT